MNENTGGHGCRMYSYELHALLFAQHWLVRSLVLLPLGLNACVVSSRDWLMSYLLTGCCS